MTGQTGRVVNRKQPHDKKPKDASIPQPDHTEKDAVLQRLKERTSDDRPR